MEVSCLDRAACASVIDQPTNTHCTRNAGYLSHVDRHRAADGCASRKGVTPDVIPTASASGGCAEGSGLVALRDQIPRRFASRNDNLPLEMTHTLAQSVAAITLRSEVRASRWGFLLARPRRRSQRIGHRRCSGASVLDVGHLSACRDSQTFDSTA